ncbi:hypothetical protein [Pseudorhodoplanes sp.]|uniref:hypothetical protein n=1 Tax=Pseudorhodoplanes sp. TaxID=1934341 RepID=UPI00391B347A
MTAHADVLAQAAIDFLDEIALAMERKWGINRLPRLVAPDLAIRFRAQQDRLNEALASGRADAIKIQAEAMARAWSALDKAASAAGANPLAPEIWECVLPSTGEVIAIVRTHEEASAIARERKGAVWTLEEVARAVEAFGDQVRAVKRAFPGAEVTAVRSPRLNIGTIGQKPAKDSFSATARRGNGRRRQKTNLWPSGFEIAGSSSADLARDIDWEKGDDIPF